MHDFLDSNLVVLKCRACHFLIGVDQKSPEETEEEKTTRFVYCARCFSSITEIEKTAIPMDE